MRWLIVVVAFASSCATTTPHEKIVTGTTQIAFGAPMALGGGVGLVVDGVGLAVSQAALASTSTGNTYALAEIGVGAFSAAWFGVGMFLVLSGQANLSDGLAGVRDPDAQADRLRRENEADRARKKKPPAEPEVPMWPRAPVDEDADKPSRLVVPGSDG